MKKWEKKINVDLSIKKTMLSPEYVFSQLWTILIFYWCFCGGLTDILKGQFYFSYVDSLTYFRVSSIFSVLTHWHISGSVLLFLCGLTDIWKGQFYFSCVDSRHKRVSSTFPVWTHWHIKGSVLLFLCGLTDILKGQFYFFCVDSLTY